MTVSAAVLRLSDDRSTLSVDDVAPVISELKKAAKRSKARLAIGDLDADVNAVPSQEPAAE